MPTNITTAALIFLYTIRHELGVREYLEVVHRAEAIRRKRKASWLGQMHCERAMDELREERV